MVVVGGAGEGRGDGGGGLDMKKGMEYSIVLVVFNDLQSCKVNILGARM